jgi:hypothetical protein
MKKGLYLFALYKIYPLYSSNLIYIYGFVIVVERVDTVDKA